MLGGFEKIFHVTRKTIPLVTPFGSAAVVAHVTGPIRPVSYRARFHPVAALEQTTLGLKKASAAVMALIGSALWQQAAVLDMSSACVPQHSEIGPCENPIRLGHNRTKHQDKH